jgi:cell division initiation protein
MEKFNLETNGYNRREVNNFIQDVIDQTSDIVKKYSEQKVTIKNQKEEIDNLKAKLEYYQGIESKLKESIEREKINSNQMKILAKREAELIVDDAKNNASRIVNESLLRAEEMDFRTRIAEKNLKVFKQKMNIVIEQQKAIIDQIDDIEIL